MRVSLLSSAVLLGMAGLSSTTVHAADLAITLGGIRVQTGSLNIALVDSQAGWDGKISPIKADSIPVTGEKAEVVFKNLAPGRYAVQISHDENGNGKFDTNLLGMPTEGYGFSNNPQVSRKPTWEEARFDLSEAGAAIAIELR